MERLKSMKETLVTAIQSQLGNLDQVDAKELGEVVDMVKDLEEAIYYCTIVEAMEEKEKYGNGQNTVYYTERYYPEFYPTPYSMDNRRDIDRPMGRMYYDEMMRYEGGSSGNGGQGGSRGSSGQGNSGGSSGGNNARGGGTRGYYESYENPVELRDKREGRSPISRKNYMEAKEMHHDKATKMKELETYMQELSSDITEMIQDASPEEKQLLQKKISVLATKIQ